jgi:hypothetical protein
MRKFVMLMFVMMIASVMAVPALAEGATGAVGTTNWVALTSGFAIALAGRAGGTGAGKGRGSGLRLSGTQSGGTSWNHGRTDSRSRVYRVAGPVHAGNYFREGGVSGMCRGFFLRTRWLSMTCQGPENVARPSGTPRIIWNLPRAEARG